MTQHREGFKTVFKMAGAPAGKDVVGYIHEHPSLQEVKCKAVCRQHPQCSGFVTKRESLNAEALSESMLIWLAEGIGASKEKHQKGASKLKCESGIKSR